MNIWKLEPLAKQLGANQVSETLGMQYFLAFSLLVLFTTYYSLWWGGTRTWLFYFEIVMLSVVTIFGCYKAFKANGGREGEAFVLKAVCLSVPIGVRINVYSIGFGLGLYFSYESIFPPTSFDSPFPYTFIAYAGFVGFNIYFWWLLVKAMKNIRSIDH